MSGALTAYRLATAWLEPFAPVALALRERGGKEDRRLRSERLGRASAPRPPGSLAWLHGASVGEALSLTPLVQRLRARRPDLQLLVTSGTVTSAAVLAQRLPQGVARQSAPVDAPRAARRFMAHWRPDAAVFVESEIWPNLLAAARARGTRTGLISARVSPASVARWSRAPRTAEAVFGAFDLVLAQDDAAAAGLRTLGARDDGRVNLKRTGNAPPVDVEALGIARRSGSGRLVWLAASTHAGEDEIVLDAFAGCAEAARLVIAPRHPARAAAIAAAARARGHTVGVRSLGDTFGDTGVYLADTLGELGLWLRLCDAALIGGSLTPGPGGHNPLEAARLERPVLSGPHVEAWRSVYAELGDAVTLVEDAPGLAAAWRAILEAPDRSAEVRRALAGRLAREAESILDRAVAGVLDLVDRAAP